MNTLGRHRMMPNFDRLQGAGDFYGAARAGYNAPKTACTDYERTCCACSTLIFKTGIEDRKKKPEDLGKLLQTI